MFSECVFRLFYLLLDDACCFCIIGFWGLFDFVLCLRCRPFLAFWGNVFDLAWDAVVEYGWEMS